MLTLYIQNRRFSGFLKGFHPLELLFNSIVRYHAIAYFAYTYRWQQCWTMTSFTQLYIVMNYRLLLFALGFLFSYCNDSDPALESVLFNTTWEENSEIPFKSIYDLVLRSDGTFRSIEGHGFATDPLTGRFIIDPLTGGYIVIIGTDTVESTFAFDRSTRIVKFDRDSIDSGIFGKHVYPQWKIVDYSSREIIVSVIGSKQTNNLLKLKRKD